MFCSVRQQRKWCSRGEGSFNCNKKKVENVFIEKLEGIGKWVSIDRRRDPQGKAERIIGKGIRSVGKSNRVLRMSIPENVKESCD